jgi:hypothetical protein
MKTIPMIFNQQMVKALMDGRKTVTRRPLSNQPIKNGSFWDFKWGAGSSLDYLPILAGHATANAAPCKVGDLIWVRETFRQFNSSDECGCSDSPCGCPNNGTYIYKENGDSGESKWKPSIHMPRKASRLTLRITDVRCERVQLITEESAEKEGVAPAFIDEFGNCPTPPRFKNGFYKLWDSIYSNWHENPWVWVIEFEVIHKNVDEVTA